MFSETTTQDPSVGDSSALDSSVGPKPIGHLTLATLLPAAAAELIRETFRQTAVLHAHSWIDLEAVLGIHNINVVFVDPSLRPLKEPSPMLKLLSKYSSTRFFAYVSVSATNLAQVAKLSRHGLAGVIIHPADECSLWTAVERAAGSGLVRQSVGAFEASLGKLSSPLLSAVRDLFERPHRYQFAADIALQAGTTTAIVRRDLKSANVGSPQKLVILAKLLRGYSYLAHSKLPVEGICVRLGLDRRVFAAHCGAVFGCSPSRLRHHTDEDEIVRTVLEWFYKPTRMRARPA